MEKYIKPFVVIIMVMGVNAIMSAQNKKCTPEEKSTCMAKTTSCDVLKKNEANCIILACGPEGTKTKEASVITKLRTDVMALKKEMRKNLSYGFDEGLANRSIPIGKDDDDSLSILQKEIEEIEKEFFQKMPPAEFILNKNETSFQNKAQWVVSLNHRLEQLKIK